METATEHPNVTVEELTPGTPERRRVAVDFLFLDRENCTRCAGTEAALERAIDRVADPLDALGVDLLVRTVHVDSAETARRTGLEVSPTIRIDDRDVQPDAVTSPCADCGELCAGDGTVDCRRWTYRGETHSTPPVELLVAALLRAAVGRAAPGDGDRSTGGGQLSDDLEAFFDRSASDEEATGCGC